MNGIPNRVKILQFLDQSKEPKKKNQIAASIGTTEASIGNDLALFTRNELVKETAGWYVITPSGRKLIQDDPFLTTLKNRNEAKFPVDWGYIRSSVVCRDIISKQEEILRAFESIKNELVPIVLMYLIASRYPLPNFSGEPQDDSMDQERFRILDEYLSMLDGRK